MQYITNTDFFAQTYDACSYGGSAYGNNTCQTTGTASGSGSGSAAGGLLTDTGFDILLAATLACTIIFVAVVVRIWKRHDKQPSSHSD
ncbi:MAG TPA: hypothetical protein VK712_03345 [Verrucomicrobiae bacterium]|jgi:hypothetical protein|nr:hypothetical protein [Verrucomicrobiae bacterium]